MESLALPLLALGGCYVIANHDKKKSPKPMPSQGTPIESFTNQRDKSDERHVSLTGNPIKPNEFKHNNMVPFYGSKGGGKALNDSNAQTLLDNMSGGGSYSINKREQAPLFKPTENVQLSYGMPNQSDFIQSRMNESTRMANTKPWQEERVAPGLNRGDTTTSGAGFNTGLEARELFMPKSVDDLRVETNPKNTYKLHGHEGPANYHNKSSGSIKTQGKVERYRVDRDFELGPNRWFTTTGASKGSSARENYNLDETKRQKSSTEYYGVGEGGINGKYADHNYTKSTKQQLGSTDTPAPSASGRHNTQSGDRKINSYNLLSNNRTVDVEKNEFGPAMGIMRAVVAPFEDVFRPCRKELLINNYRVSGNHGVTVPQTTTRVSDNVKPTIRQMTENGQYGKYLNFQGDQTTNGYLKANPYAKSVQRETTCTDYTGNANSSETNAPQNYTAAYNQRNNTMKTIPNRPNPGGTQFFQHEVNMRVDKLESDRNNDREIMPNRGVNSIPTVQTQGEVYQTPVPREDDRMSADLLTAFKNNPYTKSLHSY